MATFKLKSQFGFGLFKGKKVSEVIKSQKGIDYINWLHASKYNVKFDNEVFNEVKIFNSKP